MSAETHDDRIERTILGIQADQTDTNSNKREKKPLHLGTEHGKIKIKNGWITCPVCNRNRRLLRIDDETEAKRLPVYCRDCKTEIILDITRGQSVERRSPQPP